MTVLCTMVQYCTGSYPAETVPVQHRMQHAIAAQREAAAARRIDVLMLALPRTDPRRHSWLEAGDAAQIAGRWLASHVAPFRAPRLGVRVCSCSEFSEMLVSYLGVDSPAASSPGVLGASFSGYSGGRQRGSSSMPEVGRSSVCRCPGTGGATLMTTSPPPSSTSSLSLGFQAPWSRVASSAWLFRPRSWPRMVAVARGPALSQTIASRSTVVACSMLYDVKRISFCPSRYGVLAHGCSGL